jgi:CRP/FNR family cyclic AMP-dependent transcriptional regulator
MTDSMAIDSHVLSHIDYFIGLSPDELESLKRHLSPKAVQKGEMFVLEGDRIDSLYFVISGVVKVYKISADGKQQIINIATVGESLNDVSTFDQGPNAANMLAMTPVLLYGIKKSDVSAIIVKYPKVALNSLKVLAGRVRRDSLLVETLSFNQVIGRLAKTLLIYYGEKNIFGVKLTQQDLADMIGTSREMVNKSLKLLENNGSIKLYHNGIQIINKENLAEMTIIRATPQRHTENPE